MDAHTLRLAFIEKYCIQDNDADDFIRDLNAVIGQAVEEQLVEQRDRHNKMVCGIMGQLQRAKGKQE
jgi:hypothetical protein